jgi:hypothetical protein
MNIALIELEHRGHHISLYLKSIAQEILSRGHSLLVITTNDAKNSGILTFLKKKNVKFHYVHGIKYPKKKNFFTLFKFQLKNFFLVKNLFKKIIKKSNIDHVYVNTLDHFDKVIPLFGSPFGELPFSCLYLNPKFYNGELFKFKSIFLKNHLYKFLFFILIINKKLKNIFLVDPLYTIKFKNKYSFFKKKIIGVNDFSSFSDKHAFNKKKFNNKIKKILVFGSIKFNKGISELLNFFKTYKKNNIRILLVGKQNHDVNLFINNQFSKHPQLKKKISIVNKYLKHDSSCIRYFRNTDYVWVGYSNNFYGSSGVFFAACKMKKPVIVNSNGLINWYNKKYKVGYSLNFHSNESLRLFFDNIEKNKIKKINNKKFDIINEKHSVENFSKKISSKILQYSK